jgi:sRNA-binding regulator protein Hfq
VTIAKGIQEAITDQYKKREVEQAIQEVYKKRQIEVTTYLINGIIKQLQKQIRKYPTEKDKWYIQIILDKPTLSDTIEVLKKGTYRYNSTYDQEIKRKEASDIFNYINNIFNYINNDELKSKLAELGYSLTVDSIKYSRFLCRPCKATVTHRVSMKEAL